MDNKKTLSRKPKRKPKRKPIADTSNMGAPRIEIDVEALARLCYFQPTLEEVAGYFECSEDTIERRVKEERGMTWREFFAMYRAKGKISLRMRQYQLAKSGDRTMLKWLGQNWLGQKSENHTQEEVAITVRRIVTDA